MQAFQLAVPVVALGALLASPSRALPQSERHAVSGDDVAIYNLAGVLRVEAGSGVDVIVEVTRGGRDAGKLRVEAGPLRGRGTLRVVYPDDDIVYGELDFGGSTTLAVRDDGTFNDHEGRRRFGGGRRVRISAHGRGLEAHADLRVAVPAGKRVAVNLAVGRVFVSNVSGDLRVDVAAANVAADHVKGSLHVDTGSGDVKLSDDEGDVSLDTGSGDVAVTGARGRQLKLDTSSGDATLARGEGGGLQEGEGAGHVTILGIKSIHTRLHTEIGNLH